MYLHIETIVKEKCFFESLILSDTITLFEGSDDTKRVHALTLTPSVSKSHAIPTRWHAQETVLSLSSGRGPLPDRRDIGRDSPFFVVLLPFGGWLRPSHASHLA